MYTGVARIQAQRGAGSSSSVVARCIFGVGAGLASPRRKSEMQEEWTNQMRPRMRLEEKVQVESKVKDEKEDRKSVV